MNQVLSSFLVIMMLHMFISSLKTVLVDAKQLISTSSSSSCCRVAVIGGGAAGYFSAIECANHLKTIVDPDKYEVVIFEAGKNVLSKVLIRYYHHYSHYHFLLIHHF
jgi:NADH dehydrogenase FAD-containing subunit